MNEKQVSLKFHKEQYEKAFNYGIEEGKNTQRKQDKFILKENNKLKRDNEVLKELNLNQEKQLSKEIGGIK